MREAQVLERTAGGIYVPSTKIARVPAQLPAYGRPAVFKLTIPQAKFASSMRPYSAFVGGFGSGKSQGLSAGAISKALINKGKWIGVYARKNSDLKLILIPRIHSMLDMLRLKYDTNLSDMTIKIIGYGSILLKSMDNPVNLVGYEHVHAYADELDTFDRDHAQYAFEQIYARNRLPSVNGEGNTIGVATTPEGYRFVWERWVKNGGPEYELIQASSYSNEKNLGKGYIQGMAKLYSPIRFLSYAMGQFVNLASGSIYGDFDRKLNATTATVEDGEHLHIGMDFNIHHMAAAVVVVRDYEPYVVGEFAELRDTPAMCQAIRDRYGYRHQITIHPDASGKAGSSTDAGNSDFAIIEGAGFNIEVGTVNPEVRDRINAVNGLILNAHGKRRLHVNEEEAPSVVSTFERQVYGKDGKPDKKSGLDHMGDAVGYVLNNLYPITGGGIELMRTQ